MLNLIVWNKTVYIYIYIYMDLVLNYLSLLVQSKISDSRENGKINLALWKKAK